MSKSSKKRKGKAKGATRNRVAPARQRRQANSMGTLLGEAFAKMVKETQGQPKNDVIGLRVPDKQEIVTKYNDVDKVDLIEVHEQNTVEWTWYVGPAEFPHVKASFNFEYKIYRITLELGVNTLRVAGNSERAMTLAECLISAADWGKSWPMILGTDMSGDPWKQYSRESPFKPKHAQDHIREESTL